MVFSQNQTINYSDVWGKPGLSITNTKSTSIEINYSMEKFSIVDTEIKGEALQNVLLPEVFLFNDAGMPDLPGMSKLIAIPEGAKASLKIIDFETELFENVDMAPAPIIPKEDDPVMIYEKNQKVFSEDAFYPKNPIRISDKREIRGVDAVMLGVTPFQYNPVSKELLVYKNLKLEITYEGGSGIYGDNRLRNPWWEPILQDAFWNYNMLPKLDYHPNTNAKETGEFEYLIIVPDDATFIDYANQIKEFRRKQGISTGVFTTTEIGGNNSNAIESFIDDAYANWTTPPVAILIMADYGSSGNTITCPTWNSYCVSDNFYADVDNDGLPDIILARMTAQNGTHLETMVSKFIDYETSPPTSADFYNHPVTALGWQTERWFQICSETVGGFWRDALGKDPVRINAVYGGNPNSDPWSTATNTSLVTNYFGPNGLNYIPASPSELGGWSGGNAAAVNNAINDGCFMFQHRDHGGETGWGEPAYDNNDINGLSNTGNNLPFIWSINCLTGKFNMSGECFAEKFHRYTYNGQNSGALGIIAATESSYSFVNDTYVWGCYDNMWPDFMPDNNANPESRFVLPAFANAAGKNFLEQSSWPYNTDNKEVTYYLFHHHGDAFLNVYSEVPQDLAVSTAAAHIFGSLVMDVTTDDGATIAVTYYDTQNEETVILGTAISTGGTTSINLASCPNPGTSLLLTITKQNYYRYTEDIIVIAPSGPYDILESFVINDGDNNEAEYGETFDLDITLKNVGVETSENITVTLTTSDAYVISLSNASSVSFPNIAPDAMATSSGDFNVALANNIPDQYTIPFVIEITDNAKNTYTSNLSVKVNSPAFTIGGLTIDDSAMGNGDGILDPGETADIIIETTNTGNASVGNVISSISTASTYLVINSASTSPISLDIEETGGFIFNVTADGGAPLGTPADIAFTLTAGNNNQFSASENKEVIIGLIPEFNISDQGSVTTCVGLLYDSGGANGAYQNSEDYAMTFYPGSTGSMIEANFLSFDVESNSSCSYDDLSVYDGESASGTLLGKFCGTTIPGPFTASNTAGALTFVFHSDYSVTKNGWEIEISCYSPATPSGTLMGGYANVCVGSTIGVLTLTNYSATITSWEKRVDGGSWITIANTEPTYTEEASAAGTWEYRAVLDNGAYYSNSIEVIAHASPVGGTAIASELIVCTGSSTNLTLSDYEGDIQWQKSLTGNSWSDISGATEATYQSENLSEVTFFRAMVGNSVCNPAYSNEIEISVIGNPTPGTATVDNNEICTGDVVNLSLSNYIGDIQWEESIDAGTTWTNLDGANGETFETDPLSENCFFRAVVSNAVCPEEYATTNEVITHQAPVAGFEFAIEEYEITFTNTSTDATTFAWDFGDEIGTSTEESPVYTYAEFGNYTVVLTASNTYCTEQENSQEVEIVGISDLSSIGVNIYPNPSTGIFVIETQSADIQLTITDVVGEVILQKTLVNNKEQIDISTYSNGVYFVSFVIGQETYNTVIVKK